MQNKYLLWIMKSTLFRIGGTAVALENVAHIGDVEETGTSEGLIVNVLGLNFVSLVLIFRPYSEEHEWVKDPKGNKRYLFLRDGSKELFTEDDFPRLEESKFWFRVNSEVDALKSAFKNFYYEI